MPNDDAWYIMNELGNLGIVQFVDLNRNEQTFHLTFANQIRRCDEALKKLQYLISFVLG
jgi:V-type H+-transporting ATPase subunit a